MSEHWRGTLTALVTPFRSDGAVDEQRLRELVEFQIAGGVEGLVPCGTTGEGVTLEEREQLRVVEIVVETVAGRALVVPGAGGNATARVCELARQVSRLGVDGVLIVVPFYNKPSPSGQIEHFSRVADVSSAPLLLYNVPSRTGTNMLAETTLQLAEHGNIKGVKEASGNLGQAMQIIEGAPASFAVLSGEDDLTLALVALGADGVVSVVSNEVPDLMSSMVRHALRGEYDAAREIHYRILDLMKLNFVESNPIPVKAALAMMGRIGEHYRAPMVAPREETRGRMRRCLERLDLLAVPESAARTGSGVDP